MIDERFRDYQYVFRKECRNLDCDGKQKNLRQCVCKVVYHCSKSCQALDWQRHRYACIGGSDVSGFKILDDASYLSHRAAYFLQVLTLRRVREHSDELDIVAEIKRMRENPPSGMKRDVFEVIIDFGSQLLGLDFKVSYVDEASKYERKPEEETTVVVTACLTGLPEERQRPARISAWRCSLQQIETHAIEAKKARDLRPLAKELAGKT